MDILSILSDVFLLPWWFWAVFAGLALLVAAYVLATWPVAAVGVVVFAVGFVGAIWRAS